MQPQQSDGSNYDFIMNAGQKPKGPALPGGNSKGVRIAIVIGGIMLLIIVVVVFMNLLTSGSKASKQVLLSVAQQQTEIIRVSDLALMDTTPPAKNAIITASAAIQTDKNEFLATLAANDVKFDDKELGQLTDPETDKRLENAKAAANINQTALDVLEEEITNYKSSLSAAYDQTSNQAVRAVLQSHYNDAELLLTQIKSS